jgi:NAD(P)-dependent dehydrogenase (short-subunit alcohol dehydrogenase family)
MHGGLGVTIGSLDGKVAFISGASRGVGAGMAERFAEAGLKLVLCSRTPPALPSSEAVIAASLDVRDEKALDVLVGQAEERFGAIDLWVNNAGVLDPIQPIRDVSLEDFRENIDINLTGVFVGSRCYAQHLRRLGRGGVLLNVSSGAAWNPYAGWGAYCASKAAVERLTEVLAIEEADIGLRAHSVAPGVIDTEMQALIRASSEENFPEVERFRERKRDGAFNSARYVADEFLAIAFDPERDPGAVAVRLEDELSSPG